MRAWIPKIAISLVLVAGIAVAILVVRAGSPSALALQLVEVVAGQPVSNDARSVTFVLRQGDSATTVGEQLQSAGLIRSALGFRLAVRLDGLGSHLEAGQYDLRPSMSLAEVISVLAQGHMVGGLLTVPEGWRALEIADALERGHVTSRDDFLRATRQPGFPMPTRLQGLPPGRSLEGYLFPDSYRFTPDTPAQEVARMMVDDFTRHLSPDLLNGFRANGLTLDQAVTLASIVEREAVVPTERPTIASVYLNRLHRGIKLQADPTVQYALVSPDAAADPRWGYWKPGLTFADLRVSSPYNTYVVAGLPPGPICNPGLASLEAVAHPATTEFLYFVARPDHTHAFARTLEEQQQNVAKYQP